MRIAVSSGTVHQTIDPKVIVGFKMRIENRKSQYQNSGIYD